MDPSNVQNQAMNTHSLEGVLICPNPQQERRLRPPPEQALNCPRCDSTNTKFCYYNNYSLSQPRYFCKACRRYWTKGGSLRNVPVGGGCRKNKRSSSSSSSKRTQEQALTTNSNILHSLPPLTYDTSDLSLAFSRLQKYPNGYLGFDHEHDTSVMGGFNLGNPNSTTNASTTPGFLDNPIGYHNFYYGFGNGNMGEEENGDGEEVVLPYNQEIGGAITSTVTTVKQEFYKDRDDEERVLRGFPWQIGGEGNMGNVDSGRECWINGLGSSWHGIVNSPLM